MDKGNFGRRDRLVKEKRHDAYKERKKRTEPVVCSMCNAVYVEGRWTWNEPPDHAGREMCPACTRIADDFPAGHVVFKGHFFNQRLAEIMNLVSNEESLEKGEHPMERIMKIIPGEDHTIITTTGVHIARRLGEAVCRAYQGDLSFTYGENEKTIRVEWVSR